MTMKAFYQPAVDDDQILRISEKCLCAAEVLSQIGERVDLVVTDHLGTNHLRRAVRIGPCHEPDFCVLV